MHTWNSGVHGCRFIGKSLNVQNVGCSFLNVMKCGFVRFKDVKNLDPICKKVVKKAKKKLKKAKVLLDDE